MKKTLAFLLVFVLSMSLFAGCGSKEIKELEKGCYEILDEDGETVAYFNFGKRLTVLDEDGNVLAEDVKLKYDEEAKCFTADGKEAFSLQQGDKGRLSLTVLKKGTVGLKKGEYTMSEIDEDDLPEEEEEPDVPRKTEEEKPKPENPDIGEDPFGEGDAPFVEMDYWQFLHDELLPQYPAAGEGLTNVDRNSTDIRILGAEVLDMNVDGTEDFLVYLVSGAAICAELYTKTDGQILFVNEVQLDNFGWSGYAKYNWIGTMEAYGERFLVFQAVDCLMGAGDHDFVWYRYGDSGLDVALSMGLTPGAGPNVDEFHICANDFRGEVLDETSRPGSYVAASIVAELNTFYEGKAAAFGLPGMTSVTYYNDNFKANYSLSSYWGTEVLQKSLYLEYTDDSGQLSISDFTPLQAKIAEYGG